MLDRTYAIRRARNRYLQNKINAFTPHNLLAFFVSDFFHRLRRFGMMFVILHSEDKNHGGENRNNHRERWLITRAEIPGPPLSTAHTKEVPIVSRINSTCEDRSWRAVNPYNCNTAGIRSGRSRLNDVDFSEFLKELFAASTRRLRGLQDSSSALRPTNEPSTGGRVAS